MDKKEKIKKKAKKVERIEKKLKRILAYSLRNNHIETALEVIAADAELKYQWNQTYTDEELENAVEVLQKKMSLPQYETKQANEKSVLFYDGFGENIRGLMLIYVKNLLSIGYHVIYVTTESAIGNQPELDKISHGQDIVREYIPYDTKTQNTICYITDVFMRHKPQKAFLYTLPYDVAGIAVFNHFKGIVQRFQINLTDHAFWLGVNAFDYCIEFRDYGANVSMQYRGIDKSRIVMLPYYPYIDYDVPFQGFPFETAGRKIVFSGGGLYKTIDEENTYYCIVEKILEYDLSVIFLYAGQGDDTELNKLIKKYPDRVYHIQERKDLFQVMKRIYFYLNTYPVAGGLMMQYAAVASKVPITLTKKQDNETDGVLLNQDKIDIQFDSIEKLLETVYRLLDDCEYLRRKEALVEKSVLSEEEFRSILDNIVKKNISQISCSDLAIRNVEFKDTYKKLFDERILYKLLTRNERGKVMRHFGVFFIRKKIATLIAICFELYRNVKKRKKYEGN